MFQLSNLSVKLSPKERTLLEEIKELKNEQSGISMMDEFAKYSKIERKLIKLREEMKQIGSFKMEEMKNAKKSLNIAFYAILALFYLFIITNYGFGSPLIKFPDEKWIKPFGWIISSPIFDAVSLGIPFWIFCCKSVLNCVLS